MPVAKSTRSSRSGLTVDCSTDRSITASLPREQ